MHFSEEQLLKLKVTNSNIIGNVIFSENKNILRHCLSLINFRI